jgi:hypothetical protein
VKLQRFIFKVEKPVARFHMSDHSTDVYNERIGLLQRIAPFSLLGELHLVLQEVITMKPRQP